jgi:carbonic anhydrase
MKRLSSSLLLCSLSLVLAACGSAAPAPESPPPPPVAVVEPPPPPPAPEPPPPPEPPHWTYSGEGAPAKWGTLSSEWATCGTGKAQSPIDLPLKADKPPKAEALQFSYQKVPLKLFNNGHTVQVDGDGIGTLKAGGVEYTLAQLHLHAPSEHTVGGKASDMELHLVHRTADGKLGVVAILLNKGKKNADLEPMFAAAPKDKAHESAAVADASVDLSKLVPKNSAYYSYSGSLTTPPCTEGVQWMVLSKPIEVSEEQIAKFRGVTPGDTARPVQPLNERKVLSVKP